MAQILSSLPGTFYMKPAPDQDPYKVKGDSVEVGDTVALVEVMKTFVEIKAESAGTFARYVAEDGKPVTAGAVLAELED